MKYIEAKRCFVRDDGSKTYLTYLQGKLFKQLLEEQGEVVTWGEMSKEIYIEEDDLLYRQNIKELKRKIMAKTGVVITSIIGLGYILKTPVEFEREVR